MVNEYETKDSGQREQFATGSQRDSREGKGRYDLISPLALKRLAGVMERGAVKYAARNWEKGQEMSRCMDSAIRHLYMHLAGHRDEDHLGHAAFNVFAVMHFEEAIKRGLLPSTLDDLPSYEEDSMDAASCWAAARRAAGISESEIRRGIEVIRRQREA